MKRIWSPCNIKALEASMARHPAYLAKQRRQQREQEHEADVIDLHTRAHLQ